jgi:pimeloyl-ACP methyl ester carboxylesterase
MSFRCNSLTIADGRRLIYSETGPDGGTPVLYCHGAIGTPLASSVGLETITAELDVRYIAVSRPGIGGSDAAPGRSVVDFALDIEELADALTIERFALVGVSAGGPYALAIAHRLADRVSRVAVCSSLSPGWEGAPQKRIQLALSLLGNAPTLCARLGDAALPLLRRHPGLLRRMIAAHSAPGERAVACASFLDAAADGVRGMIDDYLTCTRAWGFDVREIEPEVHLWHGCGDPIVSVEHALQLAIAIPRCRTFLDPDEGHHFFRRRLRRILQVLLGVPVIPTP